MREMIRAGKKKKKTNIAAQSFGASCQGLIVQIIKQGALTSEPAPAFTELPN